MHFMVFPSAVRLRFQFCMWVLLIISSCFFSWGPRCLGSASSAPWRLRRLRHLRGLRPLQVKTKSWGRIYNIYSSYGEVKNGIYCWPVFSQTRRCVVESPCSRSAGPGSFCGKPPRDQASTVWLRHLSKSIFQIQCIQRFAGLWPSYKKY